MIKAILFDFGGVFVQSPFSMIDEVAVEMGLSADLLKTITFGNYEVDGDHPWHRLERGEITLEDARELILLEGEKHNLHTDIYLMLAKFANVDRGIRGPLVDKTLEWKRRGFKIGMMTNNLREFTSWRTAFPFDLDSVFDVVADSCQAGMRKPDPAFYQYTLDKLGVNGNEVLFLDDYPANIAAGKLLGIEGYIVDGPIEEAIEWVESRLASTDNS